MKRRIVSCFLALCMVSTFLPVIPFAKAEEGGTATAGVAEKEIDQNTYDAMGLTLDAEKDASTLTAPYSTNTPTQAFTASEIYVASNGSKNNVYTLRNGFDRMETRNADRSDDYGNLDGAYSFYGISDDDIKAKNGNTLGSKLTSNRGGNVLAKTGNGFAGIYATSVAFAGGDNKDNYVAELRAYGNSVNENGKNGAIKIHLFKMESNGSRTEAGTLDPTSVSNASIYFNDTYSYMTRRYVQDLDALFEIKAADTDGDGKDELYAYYGAYNDVNGRRIAQVVRYIPSGSSWRSDRIEVDAGPASSYSTNTAWYHNIKKHPVLTMAGGDLNRDGKEELTVTVSAPTDNSRVDAVGSFTVYENNNGSLSPIPELNKVSLASGGKAMVSANCAFGTFQLPNTSIAGTVLLVGGYQNNNGTNSNADTNTYGTAAYRFAYFDPLSKSYKVSDYRTQSLGSKSQRIADSYANAKEGHYRPTHAPLPLACADTEGVGAANNNDEVLFGGEVYLFDTTGGLNTEVGSISLCTAQVNSNDNNKGKEQVWIGDVVVGSLDTNPKENGWRESFLCVVGTHRDDKVNGSDDYYWMDIAAFWKERGTDTKSGYHSTQEGVLAESNRRNDTYGTFVSLALPDVDTDSVVMKFSNQYTVYTDPEVYAVLQASPYFSDLAETYDYIGNGGTAYGTSKATGNTKGASFSQSIGAYHSAEVQAIGGGEYEVELAASYSYDYAKSTEVEHSISYNNQAGGGDQVILYTVPYVYYVYDMYDPVTQKWSPLILPAALDPVTTVLNAEKYDEIAAETKGLEPISNNLLHSTPGEPETYVNLPSGTRAHTYNGTYAHTGADSSGSDITQEISVSESEEETHTIATTLNVKVGGGASLLGNSTYVGITSSTSAGGSFGTTSTKGTAFSGTVDGLPPEGSQYGLSWKLLVNSATLNGNPVWIVGYDVKNVSQPPKMPKNLTITEVGMNSIDLAWENSGSAAYYELSMVTDTGDYNRIATLPYTVTAYQVGNLLANTKYTFSIRAVSATKGSSINSPTVTATTMNDSAAFEITKHPANATSAAGQPASFQTEAVFTDKNGTTQPVNYEWQQKSAGLGSNWTKVPGGNGKDLAIPAQDNLNGYQYRCRAYYMNYTLYSTPATLTVDKSPSKVTFTGVTADQILSATGTINKTTTGTVSGSRTVSIVDTTSSTEKIYTLMHKDNSFYWFDGTEYYAFKGTAPTLTNGKVEKNVSFTKNENIAGNQTLNKSDYKTTLRTADTNGAVTETEIALTKADSSGSPSISYDSKTYTATDKWTTTTTNYTNYTFYEATTGSGDTAETEYLYTKDSGSTYQPFSLKYTNTLSGIDISTLETTFQVTETTVEHITTTNVTGEAVTLIAKPTSQSSGSDLEGNVWFLISGTGGETLKATKQTNGTYTASWTPKGEGKFTVTAVFDGNDTYYSSQSDPVTVYAVMKPTEERTVLTLTAPANLVYGNTADLAVTKLTGKADSETQTDVTNALGTSYEVKKLVTTTSSGTTTSKYETAANTDYTLTNGKFTPKLVTSFLITATNSGLTASEVIVVGKGTLTISATETTRSINQSGSDRNPEEASITGSATWDTTNLTQGKDYKLTTDGTTSQEIGEYPITPSLLSTQDITLLQKSYNILMKTASYTLQSKSYTVTAAAGANGLVSMTCQSPGSTVPVTVQSGDILPENSKVIVTAVPSTGYEIYRWKIGDTYLTEASGSYNTDSTYTIDSLSKITNVSVEFKAREDTLTFSSDNETIGTVIGNYVTGTGTGLGDAFTSGNKVNYQQTVRLTATPKDGYSIDHWTVQKGSGQAETVKATDGTSTYTGKTYDISKFSDNVKVMVYFAADTKPVITIKPVVGEKDSPLSNATITVNGTNLTAGENGTFTYTGKTGDNLTIKLTPPDGILVDEWTAGTSQTTGSLSDHNKTMTLYNLKGNTDFTVKCTALNSYNVKFSGDLKDGTFGNTVGTVTATQIGSGSITSNSTVLQGSTVEFTATPKPGYEIIGCTLNGLPFSPKNDLQNNASDSRTYQIPSLSAAADVVVTFRKKPVITIGTDTNGSVSISATKDGSEATLTETSYVDFNSNAIIIYKPNHGYELANKTDLTSIANSDDMSKTLSNIQADQSITPSFSTLPSISLTYGVVDKNTSEAGGTDGTLSISVDRKSMDNYKVTKDTDGAETLYRDSEVTFTATPNTGFKVGKWIVNGVEQTAAPTLTIAGNTPAQNIQVQFDPIGDKITYALDGSGVTDKTTLSAAFLASGSASSEAFTNGSIPNADGTLTVSVNELADGYKIEGWYVNGTKQDGETNSTFAYSATANTGAAITVKVIRSSYDVSFSATNGTVTASANSQAIATGGKVVGDTAVTFTAKPVSATGYTFAGWTVNGSPNTETSETLTLTITESTTVSASYTLNSVQYAVTYGAGENGKLKATVGSSALGSSPAQVNADSKVTFTATPATGYQVKGWYSDNTFTTAIPGTASEQPTYTIDSLTKPENVYVAFEPIPTYTITVNTEGKGSVSATVNGSDAAITGNKLTVKRHDKVILTAAPGENHRLEKWTVDGNEKQNALTYTIEDATANSSITATFTATQRVTLKTTVTGTGGTVAATADGTPVDATNAVQVNVGQKIVLTATPDKSSPTYMVKTWTINGTAQNNLSNTLTIDRITENTTVTVEYETPEQLWTIPATGTGYTIENVIKTPTDYGTATQIRDRGTVTFTVKPTTGNYLTTLEVNSTDCLTTASTNGPDNKLTVINNKDGSFAITVANVKQNIVVNAEAKQFKTKTETLTTVPDSLKQTYPTPEALQNALRVKVQNVNNAISTANTAMMDVKLQYTTNGGQDWTDATENDFPKGGILVTIPYSTLGGTADKTATYTVVHMFTTTMNGHKIGDTETLSATAGDTGISFWVDSLSPFAVGWTKPTPPSPGGGGGGSVSTVTVTFDTDGGSAVKPQNITAGGKATQPTDCTKVWYSLEGWYTDKARTEKFDFNTKVNKSMTLYAKWTPHKCLAYTDITTHWAREEICYMVERDFMNGVSPTRFDPELDLTRGTIVTVLWRMDNKPQAEKPLPFTDVKDNQFYTDAVAWAAENGIVLGYTDTTFGPEDSITREQMAAILYRYTKFKNIALIDGTDLASFVDSDKISDYAKVPMAWANAEELMKGKENNRLDPTGTATRAEVAAVLHRLHTFVLDVES